MFDLCIGTRIVIEIKFNKNNIIITVFVLNISIYLNMKYDILSYYT